MRQILVKPKGGKDEKQHSGKTRRSSYGFLDLESIEESSVMNTFTSNQVIFSQKKGLERPKHSASLKDIIHGRADAGLLTGTPNNKIGLHSIQKRIRKYLAVSISGKLLDTLNGTISLLSCIIFVWESYTTDPDTVGYINYLDLCLAIIFSVDYLFRMAISDTWCRYITTSYALIDLFTIIPTIFTFKQDQTISKSEIEFVTLMSIIRTLRVFRVQRMFIYMDSEINQKIASMILNIFALSLFTSGLILSIENSYRIQNWMEPLQYHEVFYFIVVTLSTVGYGDISPVNPWGQLIATWFILFALFYIPKTTNSILKLISMKSAYATNKYKPTAHSTHVLVCGDLDPVVLRDFCRELFHFDHGSLNINLVLLNEGSPSPEIEHLLNDPRYGLSMMYIDGSPFFSKDLIRACAHSATACFILVDKLTHNVEATDARNILSALSIKRFVAQVTKQDMFMCIQLMKPESKTHYNISCTQLSRYGHDEFVIVEEMKMNLLAKSCLVPGLTTLVTHLITSYEQGALESSEAEQDWAREFKHGCGFEIYRVKCAPHTFGLQFCDLAAALYASAGITLIALELSTKKSPPRIVLNPGKFAIPENKDISTFAFVVAEDRAAAEILSDVTQEAILTGERKKTAKVAPVIESNNATKVPESYRTRKTTLTLHIEKIKSTKAVRLFSDEEICKKTSLRQGIDIKAFGGYYLRDEPARLKDVTVITSLLRELPNIRNHVLVTGNVTNILPFIRTLRAKLIGKVQPIVILNPTPPSFKIWQRVELYPQIIFVQGTPLQKTDLHRAGVEYAASAVVLASATNSSRDAGNSTNRSFCDADAIFAHQGIMKLNPGIKIITEITNQANVAFLDSQEETKQQNRKAKLHFNLQYQAGRVYAASVLDTLLCQSFYNPQITTVLKKLVLGSDANETKRWIKQNTDVGKIYESQLFQMPIPKEFRAKCYGDLFKHLCVEHSIIPLGLVRGVWKKFGHGGSGSVSPYVYTNPGADAMLYSCDSVFILAQSPPHQTAQKVDEQDVVDLLKDFAIMTRIDKPTTPELPGQRKLSVGQVGQASTIAKRMSRSHTPKMVAHRNSADVLNKKLNREIRQLEEKQRKLEDLIKSMSE